MADSVAHSLPEDAGAETAWRRDPGRWREALLSPFLDRVRTRLGVEARPDSALEVLTLRHLAQRVAVVRWSVDAGDRLAVAHDPDVQAAVAHFPRLADLLRSKSR